MHQQPGQLDAGREAHSLAYMPVPLVDGPDGIKRHAVHHSTVHSSHQQSRSFVTFAASGDAHPMLTEAATARLASFGCVIVREAKPRSHGVAAPGPWVHGVAWGVPEFRFMLAQISFLYFAQLPRNFLSHNCCLLTQHNTHTAEAHHSRHTD